MSVGKIAVRGVGKHVRDIDGFCVLGSLVGFTALDSSPHGDSDVTVRQLPFAEFGESILGNKIRTQRVHAVR